MKKTAAIILTAVFILTLAACNSISNSNSNTPGGTGTAAQTDTAPYEGPNDPGSDTSALSGLFQDYFLVCARREKPFSWEKMSNALTADGYFVIEPVEGGFAVYDPNDENIWLGGNMTGDSDSYALSELGYFISMDYEGVEVRFTDKGDKYYIIASITEQTEVDSLDEIIEHLMHSHIDGYD